jgi:Calcineurin-like phosphoesterase
MEFTLQQKQMIAELQAQLQKNPKAAFTLPSFSGYLLASEYELILFMNEKGVWQPATPLPPPPPGFKPGDGSIEFGLFLFWFNNIQYIKSPEIAGIAAVITYVLGLPASQMTLINYDYLCNNTLIYEDGSVIATQTYATYDQGWFAAFINLLQTVIYDTWYNDGNFPMPSQPAPVPLSGATTDTVNIALVGDWGSGAADAIAVMNQITSLNQNKPDYLIHLGDVYYGGTPTINDPNSSHYYALNEEMNNFINLWPASYAGKSFTLNSNHEMYSGANGLFYNALLPESSPFSAQGGLSCFSLQCGGWTILGLDSAFNGTSMDAFMNGDIGDSNGAQALWIKSLNLAASKTIVLTHHTGFAYDASSVSTLWQQVNSALGGNDPYAWYWGHAHNGIMYSNPVVIPVNEYFNFTTNTYARCSGHGALPYGVSSKLQNNSNVLWQAGSLKPNSNESYNGFVVLSLQLQNNELVSITENFYDGSSAQTPIRSFVIFTA